MLIRVKTILVLYKILDKIKRARNKPNFFPNSLFEFEVGKEGHAVLFWVPQLCNPKVL